MSFLIARRNVKEKMPEALLCQYLMVFNLGASLDLSNAKLPNLAQ